MVDDRRMDASHGCYVLLPLLSGGMEAGMWIALSTFMRTGFVMKFRFS
jgi:hypothetical protein